MTLRRRMALATAALIVSLLTIAAMSILSVYRLDASLARVVEEYEGLRSLERVSLHVAKARGLLESSQPRLSSVSAILDEALSGLLHFIEQQDAEVYASPEHQLKERRTVEQLIRDFGELVSKLEAQPQQQIGHLRRLELVAEVEILMERMNDLIQHTDVAVQQARDDARQTIRWTTIVVGSAAALVLFAGIAISISQYYSVTTPLRRLRRGVRRIAEGELHLHLDESGDEEFTELAREFNSMAQRLESLYNDLEQRVADKSKQLVRSERLASVGFLAAGVAHEINNPLSIIAGYAELTLKSLDKHKDDPAAQAVIADLQVIRDEAFRCKQITQKLLSLSRKSEGPLEPVNLAAVAEDVAKMLSGLRQYQGRQVIVRIDRREPLIVLAREPEMKQVLLNLTVNALEALGENGGQVLIGVAASNGTVQLDVTDNGAGMTRETLDRVFEPFYTAKRGIAGHGTGLGLSIVHAIIEDHGGQIEAYSEGPQRGSRFTIRLPAAAQEPVA